MIRVGPLRKARLRAFLGSESGAVTIDFVTVFPAVFLFFLMVVEIGLAFHFTSTAQKAAQLGARLAVVQDPVHTGVWETNRFDADLGRAGDACYQITGDICLDPGGTWVCDGAAMDDDCDGARFAVIAAELRRLSPRLAESDISIAYTYRQLGVAGGPFVPEVAVTIRARPMPVNILSLVGLLELRPTTSILLGEDMTI